MKKIKTTAEQRQVGKKCNCFYKGNIYACEVIGFSAKSVYAQCRVPELGTTLNIYTSHVNWTDDPQVEEAWKDTYEARRDRTERLREAREAMRDEVREIISRNRRPVKHEKVSKRRQNINPEVFRALRNRMKSLCKVGSHAVSQFLNVLQRNGEPLAQLYHIALDIEKKSLLCYQYNESETRHFYWSERKSLFLELIERCKKENIPFGHPERNKEVICVWLPGCEVLSFPVKQWLIETTDIPPFTHPWDGKLRMNLRRIEDAITEKYGWYLRMRYPERFV